MRSTASIRDKRVHRGDPVTEVFGRDIGGIISRFVWQDQIRTVNEQYKSLRHPFYDKFGGIAFHSGGIIPFFMNYRRLDSDDYIFRRNKNIGQKVPKHYFGIPELKI